jgi:hypothetical protein
MKSHRWFGAIALGAALATAPPAAHAQSVVGTQNLNFGNVIPGVPTTILRTDAVNCGQIRITGAGLFRSVTLRFTLPTVMNGPSGATMPITFGATDAGVSWQGTIGTQTTFNPAAPFTTTLWLGSGTVYLGGRVNPAPAQAAGSYSGTIILTVILN